MNLAALLLNIHMSIIKLKCGQKFNDFSDRTFSLSYFNFR
ncbi:unnamed protein product [Haemophilus parainfluenzae T3T1]|uniref:Uncharacterized protein n=1 Tax=Haemophilus parainfluenzae (strain T3T1) TaxID=862965 RepID=A0AB33QJJ2_HAEP3|nr:unnamed protein product [Haemophilus parainfluenzae T3T1]